MKLKLQKLNQRGFDHVLLALAFVVVVALGGTYYLLSQSNANAWSGALKLNSGNLCMENMNNSNTANTTVRAITCSASSQAQHFTRKDVPGSTTNFQLVAAASGACVDDPAGGVQTKVGAANRIYLETWKCSSSDTAQVWHWGGTGNHQLINVRSGGCINYPTTSNSVGRLIVYSCSASTGGSGTNAQWLEVANTGTSKTSSPAPAPAPAPAKLTGTRLSVGPQGSNYCMDTASVKQNSTIVLNQCSSTKASQRWQLTKAGTIVAVGKTIQTYIIKNTTSGTNQCVDDWGQSKTVGAQLRLYTCSASDHGQIFIWAGDNHQLRALYINSTNSKSMCVDDSGSVRSANAKVGLSLCKTSSLANQDWYEI